MPEFSNDRGISFRKKICKCHQISCISNPNRSMLAAFSDSKSYPKRRTVYNIFEFLVEFFFLLVFFPFNILSESLISKVQLMFIFFIFFCCLFFFLNNFTKHTPRVKIFSGFLHSFTFLLAFFPGAVSTHANFQMIGGFASGRTFANVIKSLAFLAQNGTLRMRPIRRIFLCGVFFRFNFLSKKKNNLQHFGFFGRIFLFAGRVSIQHFKWKYYI